MKIFGKNCELSSFRTAVSLVLDNKNNIVSFRRIISTCVMEITKTLSQKHYKSSHNVMGSNV